MDADVVAELRSAVQKFVLHRTRPEEGTMIEARQLAARWKLAGRCLFDSSAPDLALLLAALVVALIPDHELLEFIRRHRPKELKNLIRESSDAEVGTLASEWPNTQPALQPKQRYEHKRLKRNRTFARSIEYQFGGGLEADDWRKLAIPLIGQTAYENILRQSQVCVDDIFAGESVNMLRLEELFWMDRHRFAEPLRGIPRGRLNYVAVTKVMDFLLKEQRRKKRKKSTPGPSPRLPWLYEQAVRMRVLRGIEARINSLPIDREIASAFLTVIRHYLPDSGKK